MNRTKPPWSLFLQNLNTMTSRASTFKYRVAGITQPVARLKFRDAKLLSICRGASRVRSNRNIKIAQSLIERSLHIRRRGSLADDQGAGHVELARRKFLGHGAWNHD